MAALGFHCIKGERQSMGSERALGFPVERWGSVTIKGGIKVYSRQPAAPGEASVLPGHGLYWPDEVPL